MTKTFEQFQEKLPEMFRLTFKDMWDRNVAPENICIVADIDLSYLNKDTPEDPDFVFHPYELWKTTVNLSRSIRLFSYLTARGPSALSILREHDVQLGKLNVLAMTDSGYSVEAIGKVAQRMNVKELVQDGSPWQVIKEDASGIQASMPIQGYTIQAQEELLKEVHEALQRVQKQYRDDSHVPMFKIDVRGNTIAEIHRVDPDFLEEFRYTLNNALEPFKERLTIAPNDFPRTVAGRQEKQGYTDCKVGETNKGYALELILEGLSLDGEPLMNKNNYYIAIGDSSGDKPTFGKIKELVDAGKAKGATLVSIGDKLRDIADLVFDGEGNIPFNLEHDYLKALIKYMDFYNEFHNVEPRPDKPVVTSSKVADRGPKAG